jgi:hypothetical protein
MSRVLIGNMKGHMGEKKINLELRESEIKGAGLGIFAVEDIPPYWREDYKGIMTETQPDDGKYTWAINSYDSEGDVDGGAIRWIDGKTTDHWTKYVNGSKDEKGANVESFQNHDKIYYEIKEGGIKKGEELLTWYGQQYYDEHCRAKL